VLADRDEPVAILLNNDIKLAADAIDPLLEPLLAEGQHELLLTAPLCWRFDGHTYEGFRTAVGWRWGLVQATALFPGHEPNRLTSGLTASAGAAIAVDRQRFLALGGFDPLYLPGRLEDLDLAFRGYLAGYRAQYVPESVAYHRGEATFAATCGPDASTQLALRNTLLFQWKNLRHPWHLARHLAALPIRLIYDICRAPWRPASARFMFCRALLDAVGKLPELLASRHVTAHKPSIEREFFRRFAPSRMRQQEPNVRIQTAIDRPAPAAACQGVGR
jgi:GT2 family glycosyltransferase